MRTAPMRSRVHIALRLQPIIAKFLEQRPHRIRPDISMDELGADSLDMVELQALVEEAFQVLLQHQVPAYVTFAELVDLVYRALPAPGQVSTGD